MNLSTPATPEVAAVTWDDLPPLRRHELLLTVQARDLDDLNHVNNAVYLAWCEQVARTHALRLGLDTAGFAALGAVPVARQHTITYQRPAVLGDQVRVRTALTHSGGLRSTRAYTIDRLREGHAPERLAQCLTDWVWVDPGSGRPKRIPEGVLRRFGFLPAP